MAGNKRGKNLISRRSTLKGIGAVGAAAFLGSQAAGEEEGVVGAAEDELRLD